MTKKRRMKDYTGIAYGRLTAVRAVEIDMTAENNHKWEFVCDCGTIKIAGIKLVRSGHTRSCGCLAREITSDRNRVHGLSRTRRTEYRSWKDMRARCNNPNNADYRNYGGRGISICQAWDDFRVFFSDMGSRPPGMTLDRIDVNGMYCKSNCRWATPSEQANNKRNNVRVTFNGKQQNLTELCREFGIDRKKVEYRIKIGMSVQDALSERDYRVANA